MMAVAAMIALATAGAPDAVDLFVHNTLKVSDYRRVDADLNGDGRPEALVYVRDRESCGSGGCNFYVLSPEGQGYRMVLRATLFRLPVMLLPTSTEGWRDIGVTVGGGGIRQSYVARPRYENGHYPDNPTVPPARPLGRASGEVLIGD
jgi:putative lipoprotein